MNIGKVVFGIILLLAGLWLLIPSSICANLIYCPGMWKDLLIVLKGIVPISIILLGIALIWIEAE